MIALLNWRKTTDRELKMCTVEENSASERNESSPSLSYNSRSLYRMKDQSSTE